MKVHHMHKAFAPYESLAQALLPFAIVGRDRSHDAAHLHRVWKNVRVIQAEEGGNMTVLTAAALLHDCVAVEKNSSDRPTASRLAAEQASQVLCDLDWPRAQIEAVCHAIEAHSFSAAVTPRTTEAKILQDADRLDALGALGVARCFYVAGRIGSALYHPLDPQGKTRACDDTRYALDHFRTKLLHLAAGFQTATGAKLAQLRQSRLQRFLDEFLDEI